MTTNTYPSIWETLCINPAVAAAYCYWQDDGFGNLINTITMCCNDENRTRYLYAFLEREYDLIYNPLFYGIH